MKWFLFVFISYVVMYVVVWLHEIGHSIFYYKYGVKDNWICVNVKPYIFFSTPGKLDIDIWNALTNKQYLAIAYAGIIMNAVWVVISGVVIACVDINNQYLLLAVWMFITLHLGEICSYLFIGSIYTVSDMQIISRVKPQLRIPNILVGAILAILYVYILLNAPSGIEWFVIGWNGIMVTSMCAGRVVFNMKNK